MIVCFLAAVAVVAAVVYMVSIEVQSCVEAFGDWLREWFGLISVHQKPQKTRGSKRDLRAPQIALQTELRMRPFVDAAFSHRKKHAMKSVHRRVGHGKRAYQPDGVCALTALNRRTQVYASDPDCWYLHNGARLCV